MTFIWLYNPFTLEFLYMAYMTLYAFMWLKCLYMAYNSYMPLYGLKPLRVISHIEAF